MIIIDYVFVIIPVRAIYSQTEPQFLQYIYLVAPISLLILNPIGFIMLDIHKAKHSSVKRYERELVSWFAKFLSGRLQSRPMISSLFLRHVLIHLNDPRV